MGKASQLKIHQHQAAGQYARDGGHFGLLRHQEDHANSGRGKYMIFFFVAALSASAKMLAAQRSSISALVEPGGSVRPGIKLSVFQPLERASSEPEPLERLWRAKMGPSRRRWRSAPRVIGRFPLSCETHFFKDNRVLTSRNL
ncbi:MAG: hypothetical protein ABSH09_00365 [Bryobacteraceae bacterium]